MNSKTEDGRKAILELMTGTEIHRFLLNLMATEAHAIKIGAETIVLCQRNTERALELTFEQGAILQDIVTKSMKGGGVLTLDKFWEIAAEMFEQGAHLNHQTFTFWEENCRALNSILTTNSDQRSLDL